MRVNALRAVGAKAPRLLACDLDGTLLDETGAVRPTVKAALAAVRASGVHVVLATGRSSWAVAETAQALDLTGPQIVMNGGAYVSPLTGEVTWAKRLEPELAIEGIEIARRLGSSPVLGFLDGHACECDTEDPGVPGFVAGSRLRSVRSVAALAGLGPIRVYIPTSPSLHGRAVAEAADRFGDRASIVYGDKLGLEIMAPNTNKGEALAAVAAALGIERDEVAAMGDAPNDREMLAFAGRSAALLPGPASLVGNEPVLAPGRLLVPSSAQDGAVVAMRRFFPDLDLGRARSSPAVRLNGFRDRHAGVATIDAEPEADLSAA